MDSYNAHDAMFEAARVIAQEEAAQKTSEAKKMQAAKEEADAKAAKLLQEEASLTMQKGAFCLSFFSLSRVGWRFNCSKKNPSTSFRWHTLRAPTRILPSYSF